MTDLSSIVLEIREVGENVFSNSQDLFLLLNIKVSDDSEGATQVKHGLNLVENILTILTYLATLDLEILDRGEELMNEVNKIKFSCYGLQTALSKINDRGKHALSFNTKNIRKLLTSVKNSVNKIITISYLLEKENQECNDIDTLSEESEDMCYKDRQTCEQYCSNGFCIEDKAHTSEKGDLNCPEYTETFTESSLTHVENGYDKNGNMPWYVTPRTLNTVSEKEIEVNSIWDILKRKLPSSTSLGRYGNSPDEYPNTERSVDLDTSTTFDALSPGKDQNTEFLVVNDTATTNNDNLTEETKENLLISEELHEVNCESNSSKTESETPTTLEAELEASDSPTTVEAMETTTLLYSESIAAESYDTTQHNYEATTYSYHEVHTKEPPTTPSYETTTQDMYKLSQDIYQAAQDLSSKSSEISSMSSEISSKSSDISSLVSDLNNYDDDELSKKIQGISKMTQEINSKTSEISSLTSTMSSLTSDISSASSDITTADRHHAFRTTPWQKMSSKCDDLITSAQGVVTAAQDILVKVAEVTSATADLKVATTVANMAGQITAKAQRLITEALSIVSKVIELINVIDS